MANDSIKLFVDYLLKLTECEAVKHLLTVSLYDNRAVVEISLLLLRLLRQNVTVISVLTLDLACSSKRETLLCSGLSFNFWHFFVCLIINNVWQRIYQALRTSILLLLLPVSQPALRMGYWGWDLQPLSWLSPLPLLQPRLPRCRGVAGSSSEHLPSWERG